MVSDCSICIERNFILISSINILSFKLSCQVWLACMESPSPTVCLQILSLLVPKNKERGEMNLSPWRLVKRWFICHNYSRFDKGLDKTDHRSVCETKKGSFRLLTRFFWDIALFEECWCYPRKIETVLHFAHHFNLKVKLLANQNLLGLKDVFSDGHKCIFIP